MENSTNSPKISWRIRFAPHQFRPEEVPNPGWYSYGKVILDYLFAILLVIPATPIILVSMLVVKLTSRGPAIYTQVRLGKHGQPYHLHKIRTMVDGCERLTGPTWSVPGDPRVTRVGHFLRVTHLDELPQLFNVLRGEMSLVGPRPERPEIVPSLAMVIPSYHQRLLVKPGITGLAQVQLPADTDLDSVRRKLTYDVYYVRRFGLWLDLRLIACTAFKMFGMSYAIQRRLFVLPHPDKVQAAIRLREHDDVDAVSRPS
jgi:lipopolysaccharide/colanic/teichoic acid biosynthesis glycosyltransferase